MSIGYPAVRTRHTTRRSAAWQLEPDSQYLRLGGKSPKRPTPLENPQVRQLSIFAKLVDAQPYPDDKKYP